MLQRQDLEITLNKGLDSKTSDAFQTSESATNIENLHFDQIGELAKRPGYATEATITALSGSTYTNAQVETLFSRGNEVVGLTADNGLLRIDPTAPTTALYTARKFLVSYTDDKIPKYSPKACRV